MNFNELRHTKIPLHQLAVSSVVGGNHLGYALFERLGFKWPQDRQRIMTQMGEHGYDLVRSMEAVSSFKNAIEKHPIKGVVEIGEAYP